MSLSAAVNALYDLDFDIRSYSGRGMFGDTCLSIVTDDTVRTLKEIGDELGDLADLLGAHKIDAMGTDQVVYWPNVSWTAVMAACEEES